MGFWDEYNKALQDDTPKKSSGGSGSSGGASDYWSEYNKVVNSGPIATPAVYRPGVNSRSRITLPLRPGTTKPKRSTLPYRSGSGSNERITLPNRVGKDDEETDAPVKDKVDSRLTVDNKKDEEEDKDKKWYQKGHFEDGYDFGDITKTILGIEEDTASLKDLTINSAKRGYYHSLYGEETFKEIFGEENQKDVYKEKLESDEYQFAPGNDLASGISGAFELVGQMARQYTNPRTLAMTGGAAGLAFAAGQAGPQVALPEEVLTVPSAVLYGFKTGSALSNLEIEAGHAYNEMIEMGVKEDIAKKIALGVGSGNVALEFAQLGNLEDAFKTTAKKEGTEAVWKLMLKELQNRGIDVLTETAQEVGQELVTTTGVQAANYLDKGEAAYSTQEVGNRLWDTAKSSLLTFGMMNVPATAKNTYSIIKDNKNVPVNQTVQNDHPIVEQIPNVQQEINPGVEEVKPVVEDVNPVVEQTEVKPPKRTLYTGSANTDIKQFKVGGVDGSKQTGDRYGRGVYLTTNESTAKNYAGDNGRVYQINADDLNIFDLNDTITPEMRDSLVAAFNGGDKQFRNSMLRNFRTEMTFDDFKSAEAFFDKQRKVWKEQDGEYAANKPVIKDADYDTGKAVIEFTDFENWENNIGTLTGNHLYDALKSLSTDDFSSFITGHGFDGIAFDEDSENQQYVIYRNEDRLRIDEPIVENAPVEEIAPAPTVSEMENVETGVETGNNNPQLEQMIAQRDSLHETLMDRYNQGLYNEETERLANEWSKPNYQIESMKNQQSSVNSDSATSSVDADATPAVEQPVTTEDKAKKHFRDSALDYNKLFDDDTPENVTKFKAVQKSTEEAQNFVSKGADGVKGIPEIFGRISENGALDDFENYLRLMLNVDRTTLDQRFGMENREVFGKTTEDSQKEADRLLEEHPEFKQAAEDVYAWNNYVLDMRVKAGRITQEMADRLRELYPHYVPLSRSRYGNSQDYSPLLEFMRGQNPETVDIENIDSFLGEVDSAATMHKITSSGYDFNPLIDTMVNQAFVAHWDVAMNQATDTFAPVATDGIQSAPMATDNVAQETHAEAEPDKVTFNVEPDNEYVRAEDFDSNKLLENRKGIDKVIHDVNNAFQEYILDHGFVFEKKSKKTGNRALESKWHANRNASASAQHFIGNGNGDVRAVTDILKEVKKSGLQSEFYSYLGHLRNKDGMSLQSRYGVANNQNFMGRENTFAKSTKAIKVLEDAHPEFKAWAEDVYKNTDYILDQFVERKMITQDDKALIKELYPHYIPMRFSSKGEASAILETLAQFINESFSTLAMNDFGVELKNTLNTEVHSEPMNIDTFIKKLDSGESMFSFGEDGEYKTFTVYENGQLKTFDIDSEMYMALKDSHNWMNMKIPVFHQVNEGFRKFCTEWNIFFSLKNGIKDPQDIMYNSQHPIETYAELTHAGEAILFNESAYRPYYEEYLANGGEPITYFDSEKQRFTSWTDPAELVKYATGLKAFEAINNRVETNPRLAEYIASRKMGKSVEESMLDAARVTTNFAAGGKFTKFLNRNGCTFLNASVQGALQHARNFVEAASDSDGKLHFDTKEAKIAAVKGTTALITRAVVTGMAAIAINDLRWKDDEDYEALPDYVKDGYYLLFKYGDGQFFRLPKGRTNATIEKGLRTVAEASFGDDNADWNSFFDIVMENIAPNSVFKDNILAPIREVGKNESWYGEEIETDRLKTTRDENGNLIEVPVTKRFDEKTDTISIELSKKLDEKLNDITLDEWLNEKLDGTKLGEKLAGFRDGLSPKEINYLINSYTGVLGDLVLPYYTPKAESSSDNPLIQSLAPLKDIFTTDSVLNNRVTGDFYETLEAAEAKADSENATLEDKLKSGILIGYNVELSDLYEEQRNIQMDENLSDSEKYERTREIKKEINALQEKGLKALEDYSIDGIYAEAGDKRYNYGYDTENEVERWFEVKPKTKEGEDNWYYTQEQLYHDNLGVSYADFWNKRYDPENLDVKSLYDERNGKRYNFGYDDENDEYRWFEITPKKSNGEDNYYYYQEQRITKDLGISYDEYWNNREMYDDFYYVAGGYDKETSADDTIETARAVFGYERFAEYANVLKEIKADKDKNGEPIKSSRYPKVQAYVNSLDIPDIEKKILYTMEYPNYKKYKREIVKYLDNNNDISYSSYLKILNELGYKIDSKGYVTW